MSKREYDSCSVLTQTNNDQQSRSVSASLSPLLILNCSSPLRRRRFTILFEPFQSIPNVPEYKPGKSYYFISESWFVLLVGVSWNIHEITRTRLCTTPPRCGQATLIFAHWDNATLQHLFYAAFWLTFVRHLVIFDCLMSLDNASDNNTTLHIAAGMFCLVLCLWFRSVNCTN